MSGTGVDVAGVCLPGSAAALPRVGAELMAAPVLACLLGSLDPAGLDDDGDVLDVAVAFERLAAWAVAGQLAALAELARRPMLAGPDPGVGRAGRGAVGSSVREFAADEAAAALGIGQHAAQGRLQVAVALAGRLPGTAAALAAGRVDYPRAAAMVEETGVLGDEAAAAVEQAVLAGDGRANPSRWRQAARRAVLRADAGAADARTERARADRGVRVYPAGDGIGLLEAQLPVEHAAAVDAVLTSVARGWAAAPGEQRTMAQLRADALAAPFLHALATGVLAGADPATLARHQDRLPGIHLHIHTENPPADGTPSGDRPAEVEGLGPIAGRLGRTLAAQATVSHYVARAWIGPDEPGYRPSAALDRHVRARDVRCRFPGCGSRARACDLDHTAAWPGGPTGAANLGALCRRHHRLKHSRGVSLEQPRPGHFRWVLPTGHTYAVGPPEP